MNCPNGHLSTSNDCCSVCGVKMTADPESVPTGDPNTLHESESAPLEPPTGDSPVAGWRVECRAFKDASPEQSTPSAVYESSTEIVLKNPVTQIGRSSKKRNLQPEIACDWDGAVSHRHAKIELDPDGNAFLVDLGSTNGTMLNGQLISANTPVKLNDGDRISLGGKTALVIHGPRQQEQM